MGVFSAPWAAARDHKVSAPGVKRKSHARAGETAELCVLAAGPPFAAGPPGDPEEGPGPSGCGPGKGALSRAGAAGTLPRLVTQRSQRFTTPDLDGVFLHAIHRGEPSHPKLVLLHGGGANAHWWDHLADALAHDCHVVALDFRGHGISDHPDEIVAGAFQRDLSALLDHLAAPDAALVGHSMGGEVALTHAAHSSATRAVVAIDVARGAADACTAQRQRHGTESQRTRRKA